MKRPLNAALDYVSGCDWFVFPAPPNTKKSYSSQAVNGRPWGMTKDATEICRYWQQWPDANVGLPCGANGLVVLDVDTIAGHGVDGMASLRDLEASHGRLPITLRAVSPSGSTHLYFFHPGVKIRNSESKLGPGLDVRADGGMVLAPPSLKDGRAYRWTNSCPIAPMPSWLVELTRSIEYVAPHQPIKVSNATGYAAAALRLETEAVASAAPNTRNAALNRSSFCLHQLVAGGELNRSEVERALLAAATSNGLVQEDGMQAVLQTIRSGARAGLQHPRGRR